MGAIESKADQSDDDTDDELTPVTPDPTPSRQKTSLRCNVPTLDLTEIIKETQEPVVVYNDPKAATKSSMQKGCFDALFCLEPETSIEVSQIHNARRITQHVHNGSIKTAYQTKQTMFPVIDWKVATYQGRVSQQVAIQNIEEASTQIEQAIKDMDLLIYGGSQSQTAEEKASSVRYDKVLSVVKSILELSRSMGLRQLRETAANICTIARAGNSRKSSNLIKSQYLRLCGEYSVMEKNLTAIRNEVEKVKSEVDAMYSR